MGASRLTTNLNEVVRCGGGRERGKTLKFNRLPLLDSPPFPRTPSPPFFGEARKLALLMHSLEYGSPNVTSM